MEDVNTLVEAIKTKFAQFVAAGTTILSFKKQKKLVEKILQKAYNKSSDNTRVVEEE